MTVTVAETVRQLVSEARFDEAWHAVTLELRTERTTRAWNAARNVLRAGEASGWSPGTRRQARLAVLCTYEATEFREYLRIACLAFKIQAELYVAPYGQVEQELLGGDGRLAAFAPTHVLFAPTTEDLAFPELTGDPEPLLDAAQARWRGLWSLVTEQLGARVLQHAFVVPEVSALGHLALRMPGSQLSMVRELNRRLAAAAGADVLLLDAEWLAAGLGKARWLDPRLWHAARQPFTHEALPVLARETAAVLAGDLGLVPRCLVFDLDNTLWGGVVGEEGAHGVAIGEGPEGEAYAALQEFAAALAQRGIVLAVASKNDLQAAREPFDHNPAMRLKFDDFAAFVADWRPKSEQVSEIAATLGLGLESVVLVDDNPAECAQVAAALPEVTTICLDMPPAERVRALSASVNLELPWLSREDLERARSYAGRAKAAGLLTAAASIEEFWSSLDMRARVQPIGPDSLERAAQLTQKTNQFNLTLRRHPREMIEQLAGDASAVCLTLELDDRFARHGLIGLAFAVASPEDQGTAVIDTLLMSCRVIGRTAESHLLLHLSRAARTLGYQRLRGIYVPGPRNQLVADLYPRLGFSAVDGAERCWDLDLTADAPIESHYIADRS